MTNALSVTRLILFTLAVLAVVALAWVIIQIKSIIFVLMLGIIFAAAIEPIVFRLRRAGLRRGQAILLVYATILTVVIGGLYLLVPEIVKQFDSLDAAIPDMFDKLRQRALDSDNALIRQSGYQALWRIENTYNRVRASPEIGQDQAVGAATSVLGVLFTLVSLLIVAFYWMTEKATIKRVILGLFSLKHRARAHEIWDEIEYRIGGWTRGQLVLMIIIGSFSGVAYWFDGPQVLAGAGNLGRNHRGDPLHRAIHWRRNCGPVRAGRFAGEGPVGCHLCGDPPAVRGGCIRAPCDEERGWHESPDRGPCRADR